MKKTYLLSIVFFSFLCISYGQQGELNTLKIGDKLIIGEPSSSSYIHINIPRKNFILKRGGLPKIAGLKNQQVTITDISYGKSNMVTFRNANGKKFFNVYKTISADLDKALETGELLVLKKEI